MKMNHEWTRINTNTDEPASTTSGTKMLLQFGSLGLTMSWDEGFPGARASRPHNDSFLGARASRPHDEGFPGARASRPHQACHSLDHLPHLDQPGTAPWVSFGLAAAVPADRVAACSIALKLSGGQRDRMRAGRPRSQVMHDRADHSRVKQVLFQTSGAPALPGRSSEVETGLFQTSGAPALPGRSSEGETRVFQVRCQ